MCKLKAKAMKPRKQTAKDREYLFFRSLYQDYHGDDEAMDFIKKLSRKSKHNQKIKRIVSK